MFKSRFLKILGAITVINILARLLGFAREITIGYEYGTTYQSDSIITAFTIPNFLYTVLGGAVTTAFISVYSKLNQQVKQDFVQTIYTLLSMVVGVITVVFMLFPAFWMKLFFPGLSGEELALTSHLFLWTAPATFFLVVSMLFSGLHNVYENYRLSSVSSLLFNGFYFVIGFGLTPFLMEYSYALGATLGSVSMFILLVYQIKAQGLMSLRFKLLHLPETKHFIKLALPLIFGGATIQLYIFIQRFFASGLNEGAVSAINYASKMTQLPQAVLMASVTTIVYPLLAKAAGEGNYNKINQAYKQGFRLLTIILLPASIFLFFYAKEVIMFVFQYGNFSEESTNVTYPLLQLFSLTIFSLAMNTYITRFYYALEHTLLPNVINVLSVFGVNILVIVLWIEDYGATAIALGTVVSTIFNMLLLIVFAKVKLKLTITNWKIFIKLVFYIVLSIGFIWAISVITIPSVFLTLVVGGLVMLALIGGGLKLITDTEK
jgi:putative peptidoglycan lipid II flippase